MRTMINRRRAAQTSKVLPSGYAQLEYITTDSSTLFRTGFIPNERCRVEVTFQGTATTTLKAGAMFGVRDGYKINGLYLRTQVSSGSATTTTFELGIGGVVLSLNDVNINSNDIHVYGVNAGVFYVDDTIVETTSETTSPSYELYLMAINNADSRLNVSSPIGKLYRAQIWDDSSKLVRDYIPVKRLSDNVTGLFDLENNTFVTNG